MLEATLAGIWEGFDNALLQVKWEKIFNKTPPEVGPSGPSQQSPLRPKLPTLFLDEVDEDDKDMEKNMSN